VDPRDNLIASCPLGCGSRTHDPTMACATCHAMVLRRASRLVLVPMQLMSMIVWVVATIMYPLPWWASVLALIVVSLSVAFVTDMMSTVIATAVTTGIGGPKR